MLVSALVAAGVGYTTRYGALELGWLFMIGLGLASVASELVYFSALYACLRRNGELPPRWYARSFEHHHLLSRLQKGLVLPFFFVGFVGLMVALLIAVMLVFAAIHTLFG